MFVNNTEAVRVVLKTTERKQRVVSRLLDRQHINFSFSLVKEPTQVRVVVFPNALVEKLLHVVHRAYQTPRH